MAVYTPPNNNNVNFELTLYSAFEITNDTKAVSIYTVPNLNAINFILFLYSVPVFSKILFEIGVVSGGSELIKNIDDTLNFSDSLILGIEKINTDSIAISDVISKTPIKIFVDNLTLNDFLISEMMLLREFSDIITLEDNSGLKEILKQLTDTFSLSDEFYKEIQLIKTESVTLSDDIIKFFQINKNDIINFSDSISKKPSIAIIDSITLSDFSIQSKLLLLQLTDSITLSEGTIFFSLQKTGTGSLESKLKRWDGSKWVSVNTLIVFRNI